MRDVHIHIDEIVLDGVEVGDPAAFRAALETTLAGLAREHHGEYPSGAAYELQGSPVSAEASLGAEVARSAWHSIVPDGGHRGA